MLNKNQNIPTETMYYVYVLIDPRNEQPFYVGKGKGKRVEAHYYNWESDRMANPYKAKKIEKLKRLGHEPKYEIVFENSNVNLVYEEEKRLIAKWGRHRYDTGGILTNIRKGGEGSPETCRAVKQYNLFGEYIQTFPSCLAAAKSCGRDNSSIIVACCRKKPGQKSAYKHFWSYADKELDLQWCFGKKKPVYQWDLEGNFIARYITIADTEKLSNIRHSSVRQAIRLKTSAYGFQWTKKFESPGKYVRKTKPIKISSIYQWRLDGTLVNVHCSMKEVKEELSLTQGDTSNIRRCFKTKGSAYGFRWTLDDNSPGDFKKYTDLSLK